MSRTFWKLFAALCENAGKIREEEEQCMYMVYWSTLEEGTGVPHAELFDTNEMVAAMKFMEELRARQRTGEAVRFITMCSEHPDVVGHPGVDVTGPDYNWKKRRS
jgi:hypothetical protein